ncbi:MAG: AAA family ATPase [Anaerolineae bacterium]|nr:AAA family ATPase [Anaerolineae bacterium]
MSHLSLLLLGAFQATLDGEPITAFRSAKARALLAYLAVEADRPHRRETLEALLWPEEPDSVAHNNFRNTLSVLRKALGDRDSVDAPFLIVTRETVQFNCTSDCWLDVRAFQKCIAASNPGSQLAEAGLLKAAALYRGDFLEGFYVHDSVPFEDWALLIRDRLQRQAGTALQRLVEIHEDQGDYDHACAYAWRWTELEPWQEDAYQHLMRALALHGQRTAALAQYDVCRDILQREFGVEPSVQTIRLYKRIRDDELAVPLLARSETGQSRVEVGIRWGRSPDRDPSTQAESEKPVFVARENELQQLDTALHTALEGRGRVVFVTGEAGQGKTMLVQAFAERARAMWSQLIVLKGNCNAYTGIGDPYLPFREMMEMLAGDAGAATSHARRMFPLVAQALLVDGPDLVNIFVPSAVLSQHAAAFTRDNTWVDDLTALVERKTTSPEGSSLRQEDLFRQYTTVLQTIARRMPLLLIIDDMQWADLGSISLLFHLGRHLEDSRILVVGAYRSEEVALGREGALPDGSGRHPLAPLVNEFTRTWGEITVDLGQADGEAFIRALLDSEPHHLGAQFQQTLTRQTLGHPLFTTELLRGMQERGDLVHDAAGHWIEGPALNWDVLPARIEAVIAERVGRLSEPNKRTLRIASVEGEVFTAEVIAQVQSIAEDDVVASLSGALNRTHRLVRAQAIEGTATRQVSRYRFRHILFQKYLYGTLDAVERARLHRQVGAALLALYDGDTQAIVSQLALHFERAGMVNEAIDYYRQAGERAMQMSANAEAILHFNKAIDLLETLPPSLERDERELAMQFALAGPTIAIHSWGAAEAVAVYDRAMELSQALNNTSELLQAMLLKQAAHTTHAEHRAALETAEQFYHLAQRLDDPTQTLLAHQIVGVTCMSVGEFTRSLHHLQQLMACYDRETHHPLTFVLGQDPAVLSLLWGFYPLWYLGYPDQALRKSQEGIALAQELGHAFSLFFLLSFKTRLHRWRREVTEVYRLTEAQLDFWREHKMELAKVSAMMEQAWVFSEQGHPNAAVPMYEEGLTAWNATGMLNHRTEFLCVLAEMYGKADNPARGLELIEEAIAFMQPSDERYHEAELYRMRGLLRLQQDENNAEEAEDDFHTSIAAARRMEARMCELRTTTCLARLWQQQGKREEARQALAEIYGWFTEGFDTLDLKEAKALLDAL